MKSIMDALEENTGKRPVEIADRLNAIKDDDLLKSLLRTAVKTNMLEQFITTLVEIELSLKSK